MHKCVLLIEILYAIAHCREEIMACNSTRNEDSYNQELVVESCVNGEQYFEEEVSISSSDDPFIIEVAYRLVFPFLFF